MNSKDQLQLIKRSYMSDLNTVYEHNFRLKVITVMVSDNAWYSDIFNTIELLSSQIEFSLLTSNPHRAFNYYSMLKITIDKLKAKTENDYLLLENDLIGESLKPIDNMPSSKSINNSFGLNSWIGYNIKH